MKLRLYVRKFWLPNGVSAGTGFPSGPEPVVLALKSGATVSVLVYALSYVPVVAVPVALCQMMLTVFCEASFGQLVWPKSVNGY